MSTPTVTLDVREDISAGREPFPRIMEAVGRLRDGEQLRIIAPFEPRPLINVLAMQGFGASVTELNDNSFEVIFTPIVSAQRNDESLL